MTPKKSLSFLEFFQTCSFKLSRVFFHRCFFHLSLPNLVCTLQQVFSIIQKATSLEASLLPFPPPKKNREPPAQPPCNATKQGDLSHKRTINQAHSKTLLLSQLRVMAFPVVGLHQYFWWKGKKLWNMGQVSYNLSSPIAGKHESLRFGNGFCRNTWWSWVFPKRIQKGM